jgi:phosphoribosylaminoimidazole-succinocarboxamide synthase
VRGYLAGSGWSSYQKTGEICGQKLPDGLQELDRLPELLFTPDSSRFWPADLYEPGKPQQSLDKQFVRDYLTEIGWNKQLPAPELPESVISKTSEKYREAYRLIVGEEL